MLFTLLESIDLAVLGVGEKGDLQALSSSTRLSLFPTALDVLPDAAATLCLVSN